MDLPGRERRPLFVSVLLHGNEDTGLAAAQEVLRRHLSRELHRSLLLFVGNVAAAAANVRTLPGQADYNRVWPGTPTPDIPEAHMARWVFDYAASRRPFASIDIHNNTGLNPHYACIRHCHVWTAPADQGLFCGGAFDRGCGHVFGLSMRVLTPRGP